MKATSLKLGLVLLTIFFLSCSKDEPSTTPEPISDPIENPIPDPTPDPTPDPDPEPITQSDISTIDDAVLAFMQKYDVPGAAIAVSVDEKMVYTKGYGQSNLENNTDTQADDVFRVASLSKPFTATAIMKLIDEDKLELSDKVFGPNGVLGDDFGTAVLSANELEITVDHLLVHGSGGWGNVSGDPIGHEPQLDTNGFIEYILNNWNLPNAPGTSFEYSNTGYWFLARIIEKVSGQSYEDYLKSMVAPTGISSLKTTTFRQEDRAENEVEYYGTQQDMQWIYTIASRRDGDGGVVISAPDMLRFMCAVDGRPNRTDIVSSSSQSLMAAPSEISHLGRGLGTWEAQDLLFFTGSLPGTRTWFYMNGNGVSAVVLLNYRRTDVADFDNDLNTLVYNMVKDGSISWQTDLDQF
ncbi:serine hydrolase domain-containing protein [Maribacter halichondriae]|uniref:serine hydrolase domain-containing protein n=1 Tax=Maribacter halichondriae TaxID=2980554 RepID=UPI002359D081|nr:serine hydrolase domain-containing protein [Maribacter sp. Hal144]